MVGLPGLPGSQRVEDGREGTFPPSLSSEVGHVRVFQFHEFGGRLLKRVGPFLVSIGSGTEGPSPYTMLTHCPLPGIVPL